MDEESDLGFRNKLEKLAVGDYLTRTDESQGALNGKVNLLIEWLAEDKKQKDAEALAESSFPNELSENGQAHAPFPAYSKEDLKSLAIKGIEELAIKNITEKDLYIIVLEAIAQRYIIPVDDEKGHRYQLTSQGWFKAQNKGSEGRQEQAAQR